MQLELRGKRLLNKRTKKVLLSHVERATSPAALAKGLMGRKKLSPGAGFLLVFPTPSRQGIWMFGMRFAIDIIFLDAAMKVIHIVRGAQPLSLDPRTWKIYRAPKKALYVLEVPFY
ncbi:MAG: DUF192 domain-containing protein [Nanoarchaeota archaeon]|nr:DUF192 domain-containing protein [Nanoarchaeota archaeon]